MTHRPAAAALLVVAALLTGCSSTMTPDPNTAPPVTTSSVRADKAACEKAMRAQMADAYKPGAPSGTRPPQCQGVSDADVQEIATRLLADMPTPSAT